MKTKPNKRLQKLIKTLKEQAQELTSAESITMPKVERGASQIVDSSLTELDDIIKQINPTELTLTLILQIQEPKIFLNSLYQLVLQRTIDEEASQVALEKLKVGVPRLQLLANLLSSYEYKMVNMPINIDRKLNIILTSFRHLSKVPTLAQWWYKWLKRQESHLIKKGKIEQQILQQKVEHQILKEKHRQLEHSLQELGAIRAELKYIQLNFEMRIKQLSPSDTKDNIPEVTQAIVNDKYDAFYIAFENECRGSLEQIHQQQSIYLPYLTKEVSQPVLDIGCGRGEWLELLQQNNIPAKGVDLNLTMVEFCKQKGLEVTYQNALDYLKQQPDNSFSVVTGFHIIEHLPFEILFDIVQQIHRVLTPEGTVIFETPNPENILVGSHTFYHDPTHRNPITPTFIQFLMRYHGFVDAEILRLHPYPEEAKVKGYDPLTERVNGHLCGPQDFAIITHKPKV